MKGSVGVELGVAVALLWGSVDILITSSTRHLGTLKTSIIAQVAGMIVLLTIGVLVLSIYHQTFTARTLAASLLLGLLSGLCAAIGYFAFYSALKRGPLALISPLTASSSCITFLLAALIHEKSLTSSKAIFAALVIIGVLLSSTNSGELRQFLHQPRLSLFSQGIRWALLAMFAFGFMDFGIGASASMTGWFLPVLWTRFFSLFFLLIFFALKQLKNGFALADKKHTLTAVVAPSTLYESSYKGSYQAFSPMTSTTHFMTDLSTIVIPNVRTQIHPVPASLKRIVMVPLSYAPSSFQPIPPHPVGQGQGKQQLSIPGQSFWWQVAILAGVIENMAVLIFSFDTRIITIGITSALASCYGIVGALFGVAAYGERLSKSQLCGVGLCLLGIFLLVL